MEWATDELSTQLHQTKQMVAAEILHADRERDEPAKCLGFALFDLLARATTTNADGTIAALDSVARVIVPAVLTIVWTPADQLVYGSLTKEQAITAAHRVVESIE